MGPGCTVIGGSSSRDRDGGGRHSGKDGEWSAVERRGLDPNKGREEMREEASRDSG